MSDIKPPPRYVGYPRNTYFGVPGLYGSSNQLIALREAIKAGQWYQALFFVSIMLSNGTPEKPLKPLELLFLAFFTLVPSLFFYAWFAKLAEAARFQRLWAVAIALVSFIAPYLWIWIPYQFIRALGNVGTTLVITLIAERIIKAEAQRYGFVYSKKDLTMIDSVIDHRRALEAEPTPVPAGLFSGEAACPITRYVD